MIALWGTRLCKQSTAVRWRNRSPVHLISSLCGEPPKEIFNTMGSSYFFPQFTETLRNRTWNLGWLHLHLASFFSAPAMTGCRSQECPMTNWDRSGKRAVAVHTVCQTISAAHHISFLSPSHSAKGCLGCHTSKRNGPGMRIVSITGRLWSTFYRLQRAWQMVCKRRKSPRDKYLFR